MKSRSILLVDILRICASVLLAAVPFLTRVAIDWFDLESRLDWSTIEGMELVAYVTSIIGVVSAARTGSDIRKRRQRKQ